MFYYILLFIYVLFKHVSFFLPKPNTNLNKHLGNASVVQQSDSQQCPLQMDPSNRELIFNHRIRTITTHCTTPAIRRTFCLVVPTLVNPVPTCVTPQNQKRHVLPHPGLSCCGINTSHKLFTHVFFDNLHWEFLS